MEKIAKNKMVRIYFAQQEPRNGGTKCDSRKYTIEKDEAPMVLKNFQIYVDTTSTCSLPMNRRLILHLFLAFVRLYRMQNLSYQI